MIEKAKQFQDKAYALDPFQYGFGPAYKTEAAPVVLVDDIHINAELYVPLLNLPGDVVETLKQCLTVIIKWLLLNTLKQNYDKTEIRLVGKAKVLKNMVLPTSEGSS